MAPSSIHSGEGSKEKGAEEGEENGNDEREADAKEWNVEEGERKEA